MTKGKRVFKLQTRREPHIILDRSFATKQEAVEYAAESIFLLHPDEDWRDTFSVIEVAEE